MRTFFTRSAVLLAGSVTGLALVGAPGASAEASPHWIVYRVSGPQRAMQWAPQAGSLADISYKTPSGSVGVKTLALPWNLVFKAHGDGASLAGKIGLHVDLLDDSQGVYACEILVDGQVRERVEGSLDEGSLQCVLDPSDID